MADFTIEDRIGKIVTRFPGAMEIFKEYEIDFCCGGGRPLYEAVKELGLNEKEVIEKINRVYQEQKATGDRINWEEAPLSEMIDYIINKHHSFLQEKLPQISSLSNNVLRAHSINHGEELSKVHRFFHNLKTDIEQHLIKEEEITFPLIKKYEKEPGPDTLDKISSVVKELEEEHEIAGDILKKLRKTTGGYRIPDDGCESYELTYQLLEELENDLFQHIHLENNILFPRLQRN